MKKAIRLAGVTVAMWALAAALGHCESKRAANYKAWVKYYSQQMGVNLRMRFVVQHHPDYCGWVQLPPQPGGFEPLPFDVVVGISDPDPDCIGVSTKRLALHEVCHLRWQHLYIPAAELSDFTKHQEVARCVKLWEQRESASASRR